ncbi:DUF5013 domain-containing protein [Pedobacter sp. AW31-3R]|uniref:DUF5013 domain-containing protein n=1 Tax=Pedobacter sp. AW31-3R TaxID=3445781 RepID=UPI003F9FCF24
MKQVSQYIYGLCLLFLAGGITSCEKDELKYITDNVPPVIYVSGAVDNQIMVNVNNAQVDKEAQVVIKTFGINRSGIQSKEAYAVNFSVNTDQLPAGTVALAAGDYELYTSQPGTGTLSKIEVPSDKTSAAVYFKISKAVLEANRGKKLALNVVLSNPDKYQLNEQLSAATIIVDVSSFEERKVEVTNTYFKNPGNTRFDRADNASSRFGLLKDWTVNAAVKNINGVGGFDSYNGGAFMAMERWSTPAIPNGKIYQTFNLPEGKYEYTMDFESASVSNVVYLVVANGDTLPDVAGIDSSIGYSGHQSPSVSFVMTENKQVSIGVLANFINDYQNFRVRGVRLYSYVSPFN